MTKQGKQQSVPNDTDQITVDEVQRFNELTKKFKLDQFTDDDKIIMLNISQI